MNYSKFIKKIISSCILFALMVQAVFPAFAMSDRDERRYSSAPENAAKLIPIVNVSDMEKEGLFARPGDMIVLDLDDTLIREGDGDLFLNLDPRASELVTNWQSLNATESNPLNHIRSIILTARSNIQSSLESLRKINFPDIDIVLAPNVRQRSSKGNALIQYLREKEIKPLRIFAFDDLSQNLMNIFDAFQGNLDYAEIPLKLFLRQKGRKIYQSPCETVFPDTLEGFAYVGHISGNSEGVYILEERASGSLFVLKPSKYPNYMKEKILGGELARAAGIHVPGCAVYDYLPYLSKYSEKSSEELKALGIIRKETSFNIETFGIGPYLLSQFIIQEGPEAKDILFERIGMHFVVNVFLKNFYGDDNTILGKDGKLWQIGNTSLRFGTLKGSDIRLGEENCSLSEELEEMRKFKSTGADIKLYEKLREEDLQIQIQRLCDHKDDIFTALDVVSKVLHLDNPNEVREMLFFRLDRLRKLYESYFLRSSGKEFFKINEGFLARRFASGVFVHSIDPRTQRKVIFLGNRTGDEGFCNLGGKREEGDTLAQTAATEVQQESLGNMSFTPLELERRHSSHTILNQAGYLYKMFIAEHPFRDPALIQNAVTVKDYEWIHEYTDYRWVDLETFLKDLKTLKDSKLRQKETARAILEEEETVTLGDMKLYPPFWEMLQETEIINILEKILKHGSKKVSFPFNTHTYSSSIDRLRALPGLSFWKESTELKENIVMRVTLLRDLKTAARKFSREEFEDDSETLRMSGHLDHKIAEDMREDLKDLPSQTEAFLSYTLPSHVYTEEEDTVERRVERFLRSVETRPYQIVTWLKEEEHSLLAPDQLMLFLKDKSLYCRVQGKESLEILSTKETENVLRAESLNEIKRALGERKEMLSSKLEELLKFLRHVGYAPYLLPDEYYRDQLVQALKAEKDHSKMAVFYHATDSFTSFLWDIFKAYRFYLKIMKDQPTEILRGWDKEFGSIQDVEAFIQKYTKEGTVNNYATVDGVNSYADFGLSVNPFLFGNSNSINSCTFKFFHDSNSLSPPLYKKLFDVFMGKLGISGDFKDFEAIFRQYYVKDSWKNNSKLVQIFVDIGVVDAVAYTAVAGGNVLSINPSYHGFSKILKDIRTNPKSFFRKNPLFEEMQGRLFLKPEILQNPKHTIMKTYWRYPREEHSYRETLNSLVMQTICEGFIYPRPSDHEIFFDGEPSLRRLLRFAYEGQMKITLKKDQGEDFKARFSQAVTRGNVELMREILEKHPVDLNEDFPNFSYRNNENRDSFVPLFNLLKIETPNFSEVIRIFIEKGIDRVLNPQKASKYLQFKILNDLMDYQGHLSENISKWFKDFLENLSREYASSISSEKILELYKHGCIRILSYISEKGINQLEMNNVLLDEEQKILSVLLAKGTITPRILVGEIESSFINFLLEFEGNEYQETSWFKSLRAQFDVDPPPAEMLKNPGERHLLSFIAGKLRTNSSLETLNATPEVMMFILNTLLEFGEGEYKEAPWFKRALKDISIKPDYTIEKAYTSGNNFLGAEILRNALTEELSLGEILENIKTQRERESLIEALTSNPHIKKLKVGSTFYDLLPEFLEHFISCSKGGIESIYLPNMGEECAIPVLRSLAKSKYLQEVITTSPESLILFINTIIDEEKFLDTAPWVKACWEKFLSSPQWVFSRAFDKKYYSLMRNLLEHSSKEIVMYSDIFPGFLKELEIFLTLNTPAKCPSLSLEIPIMSSSNLIPCFKALGSNTVFTSLNLTSYSFLEEETTSSLLNALELNKKLANLKASEDLTKIIMHHALSKKEVFGEKLWFEEMQRQLSFSVNIYDFFLDFPIRWPIVFSLFLNIKEIDLEANPFPFIVDSKEFTKLSELLKEHKTLERFNIYSDSKHALVIELMQSPPGSFSSAPWFIEARKDALANREPYIRYAIRTDNFRFIVNLFSEMPSGAPLSSFLDSRSLSKFLKALEDSPSEKARLQHLNLSNIKIGNVMSQLGKYLEEDTTLQILDLTNCFSLQENLKDLAAGLQKNKTLEEIKLKHTDIAYFLKEFKENLVDQQISLTGCYDSV